MKVTAFILAVLAVAGCADPAPKLSAEGHTYIIPAGAVLMTVPSREILIIRRSETLRVTGCVIPFDSVLVSDGDFQMLLGRRRAEE